MGFVDGLALDREVVGGSRVVEALRTAGLLRRGALDVMLVLVVSYVAEQKAVSVSSLWLRCL